jgi:hypothetical protein
MSNVQSQFKYDLFISYSTDPDAALARELERFLESFHRLKAPKTMSLRELNVCRDGSDFSIARLGTHNTPNQDRVSALVAPYLRQSEKLLVICSRRAKASFYVDFEVRWFLEHRGPKDILLAVSEGTDPGTEPKEVFSVSVLEAELHRNVWYDFREFKGRAARNWNKVKGFDDERVRLAADLNDMSAGDVQPVWFREQARSRRRRMIVFSVVAALVLVAAAVALYQGRVARREQGLKLIADTYDLLYRDPSAAFLKAYRATTLLPGQDSQTALKAAYKVAVLHHHNRREAAQITGKGPAYLAGRWKQGDVFTEASPDGRYQLVVTERGEHGPDPPGDVYLVNNESLRTVKLQSCFDDTRRLEDVGFDQTSKLVFVSRHYQVSIYDLTGRCRGRLDMSCCTTSPVHLVEGLLAGRYVIVAETKGGLWLVDPKEPKNRIKLQREFHGDAAITVALSSDERRALVVFESGRAAVLSIGTERTPKMKDVVKTSVLFAAFYPGRDDRFVTSGEDGVISHWQFTNDEIKQTNRQHIADTPIDWVSFSDDGTAMMAVGDNQYLYVIDRGTGRVLTSVRETEGISWASARTVVFEPVRVVPERAKPLHSIPRSEHSLEGASIIQSAGRTWVVTEQPGEDQKDQEYQYLRKCALYVINGESAMTYPGMATDPREIEQYGELFWIKSPGIVVRFEGNEAVFYPSKDIQVNSVAFYDSKLYLATSRGLYVIQGTDLMRVTKDTIKVRGLYVIGTQLWVATEQGGFVIENDELRKVTEPFLNVRLIKKVGGQIWMLTGAATASAWFGHPGPAYLVDGYLSRPLPDRKVGIVDVVQACGKVWLAGSPGLYRIEGDRAVNVGAITQEVKAIHEENGKIRVETQTYNNSPYTLDGPEYEVDPNSMTIQAPEHSGKGSQ